MKREEFDNMDIIERKQISAYCWFTYNTRRMDLLVRALSGGGDIPNQDETPFPVGEKDKKGFRMHYEIEHPEVDAFITREAVKDFQDDKMIQPRSYISVGNRRF